jgi:hypothetical protein
VYKELVEFSKKNRNKIVPDGEIKIFPAAYERYCSFFSFDKSIVDWVKVHNTVAGFNGVHYLQAMWIDIDNKNNPDLSHPACIEFVERMNTKYNLSPDDLFIYFSGRKGFHIALHSKIFGEFKPSSNLPEKIKSFASALTSGMDCIDFSIYEGRRIFRIVNSMHMDTSLYKIEISYDELKEKSFEQIRELAKQPRIDFKRKKSVNSIFKNDGLEKEWLNSLASFGEDEKKEDGSYSRDGKRYFEAPNDGNRNNKLWLQATTIFEQSELSKNAVEDIIWAINISGEKPETRSEIKDVVESAFKKAKRNPKKRKTEIILKPLSGWIDEYIDYIYHPSSFMTTGFPSFDEALRKKIKGKLGCIVGYGGSKKSLFALNADIINARDFNCHAIYSTMEMSSTQLIDRFVDIIIDGEQTNASYEIQKQSRDWAEKFLKEQFVPVVGDKIYITQNSSLDCNDYDKLIERMVNETGHCDGLTVDGLSMMGGSDKEVERYSNNTRDLKELANKWNIYVQLICHVSKGESKSTRDLTDRVRGSEKIFDNCDFMITLSQLIDPLKSSPEIVEYIQNKGYARLYDKRGSGRTINKIFDFDSRKLTLTESHDDPAAYESRNASTGKGGIEY